MKSLPQSFPFSSRSPQSSLISHVDFSSLTDLYVSDFPSRPFLGLQLMQISEKCVSHSVKTFDHPHFLLECWTLWQNNIIDYFFIIKWGNLLFIIHSYTSCYCAYLSSQYTTKVERWISDSCSSQNLNTASKTDLLSALSVVKPYCRCLNLI